MNSTATPSYPVCFVSLSVPGNRVIYEHRDGRVTLMLRHTSSSRNTPFCSSTSLINWYVFFHRHFLKSQSFQTSNIVILQLFISPYIIHSTNDNP